MRLLKGIKQVVAKGYMQQKLLTTLILCLK